MLVIITIHRQPENVDCRHKGGILLRARQVAKAESLPPARSGFYPHNKQYRASNLYPSLSCLTNIAIAERLFLCLYKFHLVFAWQGFLSLGCQLLYRLPALQCLSSASSGQAALSLCSCAAHSVLAGWQAAPVMTITDNCGIMSLLK